MVSIPSCLLDVCQRGLHKVLHDSHLGDGLQVSSLPATSGPPRVFGAPLYRDLMSAVQEMQVAAKSARGRVNLPRIFAQLGVIEFKSGQCGLYVL